MCFLILLLGNAADRTNIVNCLVVCFLILLPNLLDLKRRKLRRLFAMEMGNISLIIFFRNYIFFGDICCLSSSIAIYVFGLSRIMMLKHILAITYSAVRRAENAHEEA